MLRYPIILTPDDNDTLLVTSPDFPETKTFCDNEDDAVLRAADALGRVDGFEQDKAARESDDGSVVFGGLLAA